jgi:hypothetical protein
MKLLRIGNVLINPTHIMYLKLKTTSPTHGNDAIMIAFATSEGDVGIDYEGVGNTGPCLMYFDADDCALEMTRKMITDFFDIVE